MLELAQIFLSLIFGGLVGLLLGLLGGGGSIITVPILVYLIGQDVHAATGTSLAIVFSSALLGAFLHSRKGEVRLKSGITFGLMSVGGAVPGVFLNKIAAGNYVLVFFGFLMIIVAAVMLLKKTDSSQQENERVPCESYSFWDWVKMATIGLAVGILTGFFGVGGGFLIVPALSLIGNFPTHQAVGTSLLIIAMTSSAGVLSNVSFGTINPGIVAFFVIGGFFGVLFGTVFAGRLSGRKLNVAFGIFVILVAVYLLYANIFI